MRLTEFRKNQNQYFCKDFKVDKEKGLIVSVVEFNRAVVDKLGKLEDIEDELGIDLITLTKAMMNGIYDKEDDMKYPASFLRFSDHFFQIEDKDRKYGKIRLYKDYGKTWALTEKELLRD